MKKAKQGKNKIVIKKQFHNYEYMRAYSDNFDVRYDILHFVDGYNKH